ncbi:MAG: PAS domain S-box protein, partial [Pseudomonadota bacterium]
LQLGVADIHPKDSLDHVMSEIESQARGEKPVSHEIPCLRKDGTVFYADIAGSNTEVHGRRCSVGFFVDITEHKRTEEALQESEERLRYFSEAAFEAITIHDGGGVISANDQYFEMFGYEPNELLGKRVIPLIVAPEAREFMKKQIVTGSLEPYESIGLRKDGTKFPMEIRVREMEYKGRKSRVGVLMDITERKRMEEELLRSQKLESVGVLAGGIAHDFNNLLGTIMGNVSLSKLEVDRGSELFEMLDEAEKATLRAHALTKQLLTFAKGGTPVKETASLSKIIEESTGFVLRGSKSRCEFSIAEDLWPAEVDVGQISQVINNIVINANQAMPMGGIIQVAADNLIIEDRHGLPVKPGRYIRISIKDQGVGIAQKHFLNIFDPYFTTKQEGSGLGLATTYSIIKKHDGHITLESRLGIGTTFHIYLPASEKAMPEKEEVKFIKGQGRILLMDDDEMLKKMAGRTLRKLGYEVSFAEDGAEAIELYIDARESKEPFDVVILDLTVPGGMGGKEAVEKLLEIDPEVKAIVSSGYSDDPVMSNFRDYGFSGSATKPYDVKKLSKVLHEVTTEKGK